MKLRIVVILLMIGMPSIKGDDCDEFGNQSVTLPPEGDDDTTTADTTTESSTASTEATTTTTEDTTTTTEDTTTTTEDTTTTTEDTTTTTEDTTTTAEDTTTTTEDTTTTTEDNTTTTEDTTTTTEDNTTTTEDTTTTTEDTTTTTEVTTSSAATTTSTVAQTSSDKCAIATTTQCSVNHNNTNVVIRPLLTFNDCESSTDGTIFVSLVHCRRYYVCQLGRTKRYRCSINQWFDRQTLTCRARELVINCPSNRS